MESVVDRQDGRALAEEFGTQPKSARLPFEHGRAHRRCRAIAPAKSVRRVRVHTVVVGEDHHDTLAAALNYADSLIRMQRFEEAKSLLRKALLVAQRVGRDGDETTLRLRWCYGQALCVDPAATLDELREAVTTFDAATRTARRVFGRAHPMTTTIELRLQDARAALAARETPSASK